MDVYTNGGGLAPFVIYEHNQKEQMFRILANCAIFAGVGVMLLLVRQHIHRNREFMEEVQESVKQAPRRKRKRMELAPKKQRKVVLVTGVGGEAASKCAAELIKRGKYEVVGIDDLGSRSNPRKKENIRCVDCASEEKRFTFYEGDCSDENLISKIFAKHNPAWMLHSPEQRNGVAFYNSYDCRYDSFSSHDDTAISDIVGSCLDAFDESSHFLICDLQNTDTISRRTIDLIANTVGREAKVLRVQNERDVPSLVFEAKHDDMLGYNSQSFDDDVVRMSTQPAAGAA